MPRAKYVPEGDALKVLNSLARVTKQRAAAEEKARDLRDQSVALMEEAHALGVPQNMIGEVSGFARQNVAIMMLRRKAEAA